MPSTAAIQIQFSEGVKGVSGATIHLRNLDRGWLVRATVRYDDASHTATLTPARYMYPGATYRVEITRGIADGSGNLLGPASWKFRVASR